MDDRLVPRDAFSGMSVKFVISKDEPWLIVQAVVNTRVLFLGANVGSWVGIETQILRTNRPATGGWVRKEHGAISEMDSRTVCVCMGDKLAIREKKQEKKGCEWEDENRLLFSGLVRRRNYQVRNP